MLDLELQRAGLAAAIGLLMGIERGWQERQERSGWRVAGIRTYALIGILGGVCGFLARSSPLAMGFYFFAFAIPFAVLDWRRIHRAHNFSATNLVAGLLTFALGAYATTGNMLVAGACAVVSAAVLAERRVLHGFLRRLRWVELRGALVLLVMTVVLLPVLPDRTIDPWNALNPHQIWLMTLMVGGICYLGGLFAAHDGSGCRDQPVATHASGDSNFRLSRLPGHRNGRGLSLCVTLPPPYPHLTRSA